jgi:hypothetical protein
MRNVSRHRVLAGLMLGTAAATACVAAQKRKETLGSTAEPMYSVSTVDTTPQFAAVGHLNRPPFGFFCSGTLIAPDLVLTASHCFADIAAGCDGSGNPQPSLSARKESLRAGTTFVVSPSGLSDADASSPFTVDDVAINPAAYLDLGACPACGSQTSGCVDCTALDPASPQNGLNLEFDSALVHLAVPVPSSLAVPIQVVTDIADPSLSSAVGWVHLNLDLTSDFTQPGAIRPTIVGWGFDDFCTTSRRSGLALFNAGATTWDQTCVGAWSCQGPTACQPVTRIQIERLLPTGPVPGPGDSGSPLIIAGGSGGLNGVGGGFPDISPPGVPFVLGVATQSSVPGSCGASYVSPQFDGGAIPGKAYSAAYTATFNTANATWLEKTIADFDGDGLPNASDNCPTVPNAKQQDSNYDAELEIVLAGGCADYSASGCPAGEGHVPTAADPPEYVAHWHASYPGDACDANATTATATVRVGDPQRRQLPCTVCTIARGATENCVPSPNLICPAVLSSGLSFTSYIGDPLGGAVAAAGTSAPAFCACPGADTDPGWHANCQNQRIAPCVIGNDLLFPTGRTSQNGSGWWPITKAGGPVGRFPRDVFPFPALTTTHQEYSDLTIAEGLYDPSISVLAIWDFTADLADLGLPATATSVVGVRWGSVRSFSPAARDMQPAPNTANTYAPTNAEITSETLYRFFNPVYVPVFGVWELGGFPHDPGDPPWETLVDGASAPIEQTRNGGARFAGERFDAAGLALLGMVSSGASDLLVGDDVITGVPFQWSGAPAIVVEHGTTNLQGAFVVAAGRLSTVTVMPGDSADPPDLRSYDAADALLRSLHVDATGAALTVIDVQATLGGTPNAARFPVSGAIPTSPVGLNWSGSDASLYVADEMPCNSGGSALRLLRIDRKLVSTELWRLACARILPEDVLLSTTSEEHVLGVVTHDRSEVAAFDGLGSPRWSLRVRGKLAAAPIAIDGGASLALARRGDTTRGLLDLRFVPRAEASRHLCGTRWLRHHVDMSSLSVLGAPALDCGRESADPDDDDDDDR